MSKQSEVFSQRLMDLIRVAALLAMMMSTALLIHYVDPSDSAFCGVQSGCEAVRKSPLNAALPPRTIPYLGVGAYLLLFWLSFSANLRRWVCLGGMLGGVLGLGLLLYQALGVRALCWMCAIVDSAALVVGLLSWKLWRSASVQQESLRGWAWAGLFALSINAPTVWAELKPPSRLPKALQSYEKAGVLNVLEFMDMQCPHCRRLYAVLKRELAQVKAPTHVQRFHIPLSFHPLAEDLARAALCAGEQGKEGELTDRLMLHPLSKGIWLEDARELGLDVTALQECMPSDKITQILKQQRALYRKTGARGVPLTFIGNQRIEGGRDSATIASALKKAQEAESFSLSAWQFGLLGLGLSGAIVGLGWRRPKRQSDINK